MAWTYSCRTACGLGVVWVAADTANRPRYLVTSGDWETAEEPTEAVAHGQYSIGAAVREWLDRVNGTTP